MKIHFACWLLSLFTSFICLTEATFADSAPPLRVMSFNIRFGTANDGKNHWDLRKDFVIETIREFDPDLLGTQETLGFQRDYLAKQLDGYAVLGVGRNDGDEDGEMMAVYYRKERFDRLADGHFWLSETPEKVGSKSWDSSLPRMVTWVKLRDRRSPGGPPIVLFNTHFDHRGPEARRQSALLLRRKLSEIGEGCSLIVTGDFNTAEGTAPYQALFGNHDGEESSVVDSLRRFRPERRPDEGTFSGFMPMVRGGPRIDWIAVSHDWIVEDADIVHTGRNGRTPSDHFPVTATLLRPVQEVKEAKAKE